MNHNQAIINESARASQYAIDNGLLSDPNASRFGIHDTLISLPILQEANRRGIDIEAKMPQTTRRGNTGIIGRCSTLRTEVAGRLVQLHGHSTIKWARAKRNHRLIAHEYAQVWAKELRRMLGL